MKYSSCFGTYFGGSKLGFFPKLENSNFIFLKSHQTALEGLSSLPEGKTPRLALSLVFQLHATFIATRTYKSNQSQLRRITTATEEFLLKFTCQKIIYIMIPISKHYRNIDRGSKSSTICNKSYKGIIAVNICKASFNEMVSFILACWIKEYIYCQNFKGHYE